MNEIRLQRTLEELIENTNPNEENASNTTVAGYILIEGKCFEVQLTIQSNEGEWQDEAD